jgi:hypothetical protein
MLERQLVSILADRSMLSMTDDGPYVAIRFGQSKYRTADDRTTGGQAWQT